MSDHDRLMAYAERVLDNGCTNCNKSDVYCHCVTYLDGPDQRCCPSCSH